MTKGRRIRYLPPRALETGHDNVRREEMSTRETFLIESPTDRRQREGREMS